MTRTLRSDTELAKAFDELCELMETKRPPQTALPREPELGDEVYVWDNQRLLLHGPYVVQDAVPIEARPAYPFERRHAVTVWQSKAHQRNGRQRFFCYSEGHGDGALQWRFSDEVSDSERASAHLPPFDRNGVFVDPDDNKRFTLADDREPEEESDDDTARPTLGLVD